MATFTASAADSTTPAHFRIAGSVSRYCRFTMNAAFSAGDVVQMVKVPNGSVITDLKLACSSSAGAITVNVGDGNDTSAYAASVVYSGSAVAVTLTNRGLGRSYSAEDTVDVVITALSAVPGTAKLFMALTYYNGNS